MTPPSPHNEQLAAFAHAVSYRLNDQFPSRAWTAEASPGSAPVLRVTGGAFEREYELEDLDLRSSPEQLAMLIWVDIMEGT